MGGGPTGWHSAAASALAEASKNQRSRARSGQLQCRVGRGRRAARLTSHPATRDAPQRSHVPSDEVCGCHTRQLPRRPIVPSDQACDPHARQLPRRANVPSDQACGRYARHLPYDQTCRAPRHAAATRGTLPQGRIDRVIRHPRRCSTEPVLMPHSKPARPTVCLSAAASAPQ